MQTTKLCTSCKQIKSRTEFYKRKDNNDGLRSHCKECIKIKFESNKKNIYKQRSERYNLDKEEINKKRRIKYSKEIEVMREKDRERALTPKRQEYCKQYQKEYRKREISKIIDKNKRLRRRSAEKKGDITTIQLQNLQNNAKACYWCNESLKNKEVHIDHYVPLSKGGLHTISNLVVSCSKCNLKKHAKDPFVFANSLGKLL